MEILAIIGVPTENSCFDPGSIKGLAALLEFLRPLCEQE